MNPASLLHEPDAIDTLPSRFSKAARAALVGLILPPSLLAIASSVGMPLRTGVTWLFVLLPGAGFFASGLMAGSAFERGWRVKTLFAGALLAGGALIGVSYRSLQGLTGRESTVLVLSVPVLGFAVGFAMAGLIGSLALPLGWADRARIVRRSVVGGALGGLVAAVPVLVAPPGVDNTAAQYGWMALTVASFFGCLILPYRLMGRAFRDSMRTVTGSSVTTAR
jgi:hypothetical protein